MNPTSSLKKISDTLNQALARSAFRRGTSAFRHGLIPMAPSDHLPLLVELNREGSNLQMISWNLLADVHLYNNFMNISGTASLIALLKKRYPNGNAYFKAPDNKLYYFFSELAQYLYKQQKLGRIDITETMLLDFIPNKNHPSPLARSRDAVQQAQKIQQVEAARAEIIKLMITEMGLKSAQLLDDPDHIGHELQIAIKHSIELIHHIEHEDGVLKWANRYKSIVDNPRLVTKLIESEFLCLQECTNPESIFNLFQERQSPHLLITHRIDVKTNDYCVLIYNDARQELISDPILYAIEGKKPCIFAKFRDRLTGEMCVIGSIHHPGGNHNHLSEILNQVNLLRAPPDQNIPYFILGDYNHREEFFVNPVASDAISEYCIKYPAVGTMSGSDYGNVNQAIDAVLTCATQSNEVSVSLLNEIVLAPPAPQLPLVVGFPGDKPLAYPSYAREVARYSEIKDEFKASEMIHASQPLIAPPVNLMTMFKP